MISTTPTSTETETRTGKKRKRWKSFMSCFSCFEKTANWSSFRTRKAKRTVPINCADDRKAEVEKLAKPTIVEGSKDNFLRRLFPKAQERQKGLENVSSPPVEKREHVQVITGPHSPTTPTSPVPVLATSSVSGPTSNCSGPTQLPVLPTARWWQNSTHENVQLVRGSGSRVSGFMLVVLVATVMMLGGPIFAIGCTCTLFYLSSRLRQLKSTTNDSVTPKKDQAEIGRECKEYDSKRLKQKIVLEGLLERSVRK